MEYVRVCQVCGSIKPLEGHSRCNKCSSFSGLTTVSRQEAERLIRRRRLRFLRSRLIYFGVPSGILLGLTIWWLVAFFNLGPSPPSAVSTVSASVNPQIWAQGRRTPQNTGFTPDPAPVPRKVQWVFTSSEPLYAAPAVAGDHIYVTTEEGRALALDRESGQIVWEHYAGVPSSSSPAVLADSVIFAFRPGLLTALDRKAGNPLWQHDLRSPIYAPPVVVDGIVYIGAGDSKLHALDAVTGRQLWTFPTDDWVVSSVAYADNTVVVASQGSQVHIIDAKSGRARLMYDTGANRAGTGPVIHGELAFLTSDGGRLWAIDRRAKSYPFERALWKVKINLYVWQVISEQPLQRGSVWLRRLGGNIIHTPAVAHDMVYVTNTAGAVFARDAATGAPRWTTDIEAEITAAPTVAGETVLIGTSNGVVFGLDANTGEIKWDFKVADAELADSPVVAGDALYVVSRDGKLHSITGAR